MGLLINGNLQKERHCFQPTGKAIHRRGSVFAGCCFEEAL